MPLLDDETRAWTARQLEGLAGPVNLVLFKGRDDDPSAETAELLHELAELSDKLKVEEHDFAAAGSLAARYGVERTPGLVVEGARDYGVRYLGPPAGHEFPTLLEVMADVARGDADLPETLRTRLAGLQATVTIQVFSTPT